MQGGSTLTMQLVRNLYTQDDTRARHRRLQAQDPRGASSRATSRRSTPRSGCSASTSTRVPYGTVGGQTAIGAGAAARLYFNKRVAGPDAARGRDARRHAAGAVARTRRCTTRAGPRRAATRCWARWPSSAMISPRDGAEARWRRASGCTWSGYFRKARERYVLDYVKSELIKEYGREHGRSAAASRSTRRSTSRSRRRRARRSPTSSPASARRRRSSRSTPRTATSSRWRRRSTALRQVEVQPRRPGPPPARLVVQGRWC